MNRKGTGIGISQVVPNTNAATLHLIIKNTMTIARVGMVKITSLHPYSNISHYIIANGGVAVVINQNSNSKT